MKNTNELDEVHSSYLLVFASVRIRSELKDIRYFKATFCLFSTLYVPNSTFFFNSKENIMRTGIDFWKISSKKI